MSFSIFKQKIEKQFNQLAPKRNYWRKKGSHYYRSQEKYYKFLIPPGKKILELGCGTGELLSAVKPKIGIGIDISEQMTKLASKKFPHLQFITADVEDSSLWETNDVFDYIIISDLVGHLEDVQTCFEGLRKFCNSNTRIIVSYHNFIWEPFLKIAEKFKLKMPQQMGNWLSPMDISNLLYLSDFDTVKTERRLLLPKYVPVISQIFEFFGSLPGINYLCLSNYIVARKCDRIKKTNDKKSVTVLVPCRNEKGNIESAVKRTPEMGSHTQIIFVDGHSEDGTPEEIERVIKKYENRDILFLVQDGKGKGDAVRKGFANAKGDVLMILDADLTVPPEDLPKFYRAVASRKGEFINGTRLVYPMENEAMRFLNVLGNKFFSWAFSWLLNQRLKDTLCGTKVILKSDYERLAAGRSYFGDFDPFGDFDLLFGASKLNLKIVEVPIRYRAREYGETQISRFRHGLLLLRMCAFALRKLKFF